MRAYTDPSEKRASANFGIFEATISKCPVAAFPSPVSKSAIPGS